MLSVDAKVLFGLAALTAMFSIPAVDTAASAMFFGAGGYGTLMGAFGVGALTGMLLIAGRGGRLRRGQHVRLRDRDRGRGLSLERRRRADLQRAASRWRESSGHGAAGRVRGLPHRRVDGTVVFVGAVREVESRHVHARRHQPVDRHDIVEDQIDPVAAGRRHLAQLCGQVDDRCAIRVG